MSPLLETARSQRDVDAILGGNVPAAPAARPWPLARAGQWSRARRARLEAVQARFAAALEVHVAAVTRQPARVTPAGLETLRVAEVVAALDTPSAAFTFSLAGNPDCRGVLDLGADLGLEWVERLLGGPGSAAAARRAPTAFEQALLRGLAEQALARLAESWSALEPTAFECGEFHADLSLASLPAEETMLVAHFEVALGGPRRDLLVALPAAAFTGRGDAAAAESGPGTPAASLAAQLRRAHAEVRVRFPELAVTARSLSALRPGQVLYTRHPTDAPFEVRVNGRLAFRGQVGQVRRHLGVRITETVNDADPRAASRPLEGRIL